MTSEQIRESFIKFFTKKGHTQVSSSSLVPNDPSVLLTGAGMQQFKPYFTGKLDPEVDFKSKSVVSVQKCFRTVDIDEVGDVDHNTFFEMLGNFTFGGYGKKEALTYAYEFITQELGLDISYVTVFKGSHGVPKDKESIEVWKSLGVKDIREEGMEELFWGPTGNSGPCGPTSEVYCQNSEGRDIEIWNIVFNEYFYPATREELLKGGDKKLKPLEIPGIDTGMGFGRLVVIKQGVESIYDTDLFQGLMNKISEFTGGIDKRITRILADHSRAIVFLIADGIKPSNKEVGYILRRLIRKVLALKLKHDIHGDIFLVVYPVIKEKYEEQYPEVGSKEILPVIKQEEEKFEKVIITGLRELKKHEQLSANQAFIIASSYGLSFDLIKELAPEAVKNLDEKKLEALIKKHQEISRAGLEKKFGGHGLLLDTGELKAKNKEELEKVIRLHTATHIMQAALRKVLGSEIGQAGSDITAERTRFDFTFNRKLTDEEIKKVEDIVNKVVAEDLPVRFKEMNKREAEKTGALYFFKAKYPEKVKVYYVGHNLDEAFSKEFCGGPHVDHTGMIGEFKITKETSIGSGIRRIKATVQ